MSNLSVAISIAANGFKNKYDKGGQPYILHCLRVMNDLHTRDEELQSIAVLHDCIEDGVCTVEDMQEYAEFCIRCYEKGLPCIIAEDWLKQFKKK